MFLTYKYTLLEENAVVITEKNIDLKPICCKCLLWGTCIYSDQHAFTALLSIDKELFLAVFARKVIIPLFYHLAVLDYKPCYNQEPWLRLYVHMFNYNK